MRQQILNYIEKNSKANLKDLAIMLGTSEEMVLNELQAMEDEKIICGYHTMINWDNTDVEKVTALIEVRVTPQRDSGFGRIAERIYNYPEVQSVYLISGAYDFLVTLEGKSIKEISRFVSQKLSTIDAVVGTTTHFILNKYKDHGTVFVQEEKAERMLVTP